MKTPQVIVLALVVILCPVTATLVLAQQFTNPIAVVGEQPSHPPPPPVNAPMNSGRGVYRTDPTGPRITLTQDTAESIWSSEEQMNNFYVNKFIQSAGFGGTRMTVPTMTIGSSIRLLLGQKVKMDGNEITTVKAYKIDQLELIGIAKHDVPMAFVVSRHSGFLINRPNQTTPSRWSAPLTVWGTRQLTDFEKSAVEQIKAGKQVADQPQADGSLLVVGAVRAQEACIQCHDSYKAGDALGAFSFHLSKNIFFDQFESVNVPQDFPVKVSSVP